ncbi:MAG: formylglycine-generating enzyme family protein [Candidatus Manganitrophus sp.]|nr:formylglycine-generating enzyme family protein [Candidatus Manganitrophus sp.]
MVLIPEGAFIMGNNGRPTAEGAGDEDEQPEHKVFVKSFYIDVYETTNAHYKKYVDATGADPPLLWRNGTYPPAKVNHPVVYVSWFDADAYCRVGRQASPDRRGMGEGGPGDGRTPLPLGHAVRLQESEHAPVLARKRDRRLAGEHNAGRQLRRRKESLRPLRHGRQRLRMGQQLVSSLPR